MTTQMSAVTQASQIGLETTESTAVAALKRLAGVSFSISPNVSTDELKRMGSRWPTLVSPGQVESKVSFTGKPCYPDLVYIMSGVHRSVTPTTPGGGTLSRLWTFLQSSTDEDDVSSYTIEQGNRKLARRAAGCIFTGYNFSWDTQKASIQGEGFGGKITTGVRLSTDEVQAITKTGTVGGGTFDINNIVNPVTTEVKTLLLVPYSTTASALQTLFDALWGTGLFLVGGGPLGGTPITVEFIGSFGSQDAALMTISSTNLTGGGSYAAATTTPGVAPTQLDAFDVQPNHIKVYSDTTYGGIGGTKLTRVFSGSIAVGSMRGPLHVVDRDQAGAPVGHLEGVPTGEFRIKIMADEVADTHLADIYLGSTRYFRIEAVGSVIEGSLTYKAVWDLACKLKAIGEYGPEGNAQAIEHTYSIVDDNTFGRAMSVTLQNKVTAQ
jgi:hypothetical protein